MQVDAYEVMNLVSGAWGSMSSTRMSGRLSECSDTIAIWIRDPQTGANWEGVLYVEAVTSILLVGRKIKT